MMKGKTEKKEVVMASLLQTGSIQETAKATSVSETTIWRWMQDPAFNEEYTRLKRQALQTAVNRLQSIANEAVEVLRNVMQDEENPAGSRVTAAKAVLDSSIKITELEDLQQRIERLEAIIKEQGGKTKCS